MTADMTLGLLINRRCGHLAGTCNVVDPRTVDVLYEKAALLLAHGRRGWQVEIRPATDAELIGLVAGTRCKRCQI